jgi:hypothetical protein
MVKDLAAAIYLIREMEYRLLYSQVPSWKISFAVDIGQRGLALRVSKSLAVVRLFTELSFLAVYYGSSGMESHRSIALPSTVEEYGSSSLYVGEI